MHSLTDTSLLFLGKPLHSSWGKPLLLSLLLSAFAATPSLANDVHIVDATGGGDFPTIQQALNSAFDGDLILVRPGSYPSFVVDDLDVSIMADGGFVTTGTIRARNLSAGKVLVLAGLDAQGAPTSSPSSTRGAWFIDCAGSIRVQHSNFRAADSMSSLAEDGWDGVRLENCLDVSFTNCLLAGSRDSGAYGDNTGTHYGGGNGLYAIQSLVSVFASEVLAGDGHPATVWDAGVGGHGALLESGSQLHAHSSTVKGGDGGGTTFDLGWGGDGGHGVFSTALCAANLLGCNLIAGQGGWGSGCSFCGGGEDGSPAIGASITILPGDPRDLCLLGPIGPLREGAAVALSIEGYVGSRASMIYSYGTDRRTLTQAARLLLLSSPFIRLLPSQAPRPIPLALPSRNYLGTWSTSTLLLTIQADNLAPGVEGVRIFAQPFHVPSSGAWNLGAPVVLHVVSASL